MRDQRDARSPTGIAAASASPARRSARSSARGRVPSGDDTSSVFILYAIPVGLAAGFAIGGRLANLGTARFRLMQRFWEMHLGHGRRAVESFQLR